MTRIYPIASFCLSQLVDRLLAACLVNVDDVVTTTEEKYGGYVRGTGWYQPGIGVRQ